MGRNALPGKIAKFRTGLKYRPGNGLLLQLPSLVEEPGLHDLPRGSRRRRRINIDRSRLKDDGEKLAKVLGLEGLAEDERFATMSGRSANKVALLAELDPVIARWNSDELVAALNEGGVPSGRVNTVPEALSSPQVASRGQIGTIQRRDGTEVRFVGFPGKLSATPAAYRTAPPRAGEDTREVLGSVLGLVGDEIERLIDSGAVAQGPEL